MSRIASIFAALRAEKKRGAIMPFVTAGYPSLSVTADAIMAMEAAGASIVEVGFPFSDPIADGPVIAVSMHEALHRGVTPMHIFDTIKQVRPRTKLGLIAMVSDSIITRMGPEQFVAQAADAGFDGLIVPDIDLEAARPLAGLARLHELTFTMLIAPATTPPRIGMITELCSGFIYLLARVGVTGESNRLDISQLDQRVALVRQRTDLPIAVGFGISSPQHVQAVAGPPVGADAVIVGSAIVRCMGQAGEAGAAKAAGRLVKELRAGLDQVSA